MTLSKLDNDSLSQNTAIPSALFAENDFSRVEIPDFSGGLLGRYAKSSPPIDIGIEKAVKNVQLSKKLKLLRAERYRLLSYARKILCGAGKKFGLEFHANFHRTAKCAFTRHSSSVKISKTNQGKAFFKGVVKCGNAFTCAVCAAKLQERRRSEIAHGMDWAYESGKKCIMVTFTFPHHSKQKLKPMLMAQAEAYKHLRKGAPWDRLKGWCGFDGLIRSLEVTHGANGWHPHTHELWIIDQDCDVQVLRKRVLRRWLRACTKAGLVDITTTAKLRYFVKRAVHVQDNARSSDYFAKLDDSSGWGIDRELANANVKQGKIKGRSAMQMLAHYADGDKRSGALYLEFVEAMRRKSQIFWSHGLKERAGIDELTDSELIEKEDTEVEEFAFLSAKDWDFIAKHNLQSYILDIAESSRPADLYTFIENKRALLNRVKAASLPDADLSRGGTFLGGIVPDQGGEALMSKRG